MDVGAWLRGLGLGRYARAFRDNDIDVGLLPALTADDLRELGVASLGHRKRLLAAITALAGPADPRPSPAPPLAPIPPPASATRHRPSGASSRHCSSTSSVSRGRRGTAARSL